MLTYQQWDTVADSYIPLLVIIFLGLSFKEINLSDIKASIHNFCRTLLCVCCAYAFMAIDAYFEFWPKLGLDFSTHTALALAFVVDLSLRSTPLRLFSCISILLYGYLMWFQKYHSIADMLSTTAVMLPVFVLLKVKQPSKDIPLTHTS
jgi:hypothetical protein